MPIDTLRDHLDSRRREMKLEISSFIPHYKDLSEFVQPRRGRFLIDDVNQGGKRHQSIINSTGTRAHRIARSGLFAGIMSPTRPWLKLETLDDGFMTFKPVQKWLHTTEQRMLKLLLTTNLYNAAPYDRDWET